jgi:hypothetical protein
MGTLTLTEKKYDRFNFKRAFYSLQYCNWSMAHCNSLKIRGKQGWDGSLFT